jgi:hypothetical protein
MRVDVDGKNVNVPENFIDINMKNLGITRQECVDMYLSDEGFITNDEVVAMSAKAKSAGTGAKATGEKPKRKPPERKPDEVKRSIVDALAKFIIGMDAKNVEVTNIERMIAFEFLDEKYEVTLTKKRAPKG